MTLPLAMDAASPVAGFAFVFALVLTCAVSWKQLKAKKRINKYLVIYLLLFKVDNTVNGTF
jgi:hypothetical protein